MRYASALMTAFLLLGAVGILRAETPAAEPGGEKTAEEEAQGARKNRPGGTEEPRGFFLNAEALWVEADDIGADVGEVSSVAAADPVDCNGTGIPCAILGSPERRELEFDSTATLRLELGWKMKGWRSLSVRFWSYDETSDDSGSAYAGTPLGGLGGVWILGSTRPSQDLSINAASSYEASGDLEGETIDFLFRKNVMLSTRWDLDWNLGLRVLQFDQSAKIRYRSDTIPYVLVPQSEAAYLLQDVSYSNSSDGLGPIAGMAAQVRLGKKGAFRLDAGLDIAGVWGDTDYTFDDAVDLEKQTSNPGGEQVTSVRSVKEDRFFTTLDFRTGVSWHFKERWQVRLGYEWMRWYDVQTREFYQNVQNPAAVVPDVRDATFRGLSAGVGVTF